MITRINYFHKMETNTKKGIIFSIVYLPGIVGGAEIAVDNITKRINNFKFDLICLPTTREKIKNINNVQMHYVGFFTDTATFLGRILFKFQKVIFPILSMVKAYALHKRNKYDFVWAIMANYAGFGALFFKYLNKNVPFLLTIQEGSPKEEILKKVRFFKFLFKKIFTSASHVQVISNYLKDFAISMGSKNITLVPNGVDLELFNKDNLDKVKIESIKKDLQKKEGDIFIITTSRLVKKNNISFVIKSIALLPENYKFLILGKGKEESELKKLAQKLKIKERIFFLGDVSQSHIPYFLNISDVFIRPSISEGFGNSFLEAMAMEIPVIASPVGGIIDFVIDNETGIFCDQLNHNDIAEKLVFISSNKELRENIIKNAKAMVKQNYDWNNISKEMEKIFNKL